MRGFRALASDRKEILVRQGGEGGVPTATSTRVVAAQLLSGRAIMSNRAEEGSNPDFCSPPKRPFEGLAESNCNAAVNSSSTFNHTERQLLSLANSPSQPETEVRLCHTNDHLAAKVVRGRQRRTLTDSRMLACVDGSQIGFG